jgi:hypothetical protein
MRLIVEEYRIIIILIIIYILNNLFFSFPAIDAKIILSSGVWEDVPSSYGHVLLQTNNRASCLVVSDINMYNSQCHAQLRTICS